MGGHLTLKLWCCTASNFFFFSSSFFFPFLLSSFGRFHLTLSELISTAVYLWKQCIGRHRGKDIS